MGKTRVRTTFNPGEVLHVDDAELLDLQRQGLLVSDERSAKLDEAEAEAAKAAEAEKTETAPKAPTKKKEA